jgi:hypothetical protein
LFLHFYYLECAFPSWLGLRHGIALFLLVRTLVSYGRANTRNLPSAVTASSPQKKTAKSVLAVPSNESKGNTRATNASQTVPQNVVFVHAGDDPGGGPKLPIKY